MALRPTPAALDALRLLTRRPLWATCAPHLVRGLQTTRTSQGLFDRFKAASSSSTPPPPSPAASSSTATSSAPVDAASQPESPVTDIDSDKVTELQRRVAGLETKALESRSSADSAPQVALLSALRDAGEDAGIVAYYEAVALSPEVADCSKSLLQSNEAWELYATALAITGRTSHLATAVRARDKRLDTLGLSPSSAPSTVSSSPIASSTPAPAPAAAAATATSAAPPQPVAVAGTAAPAASSTPSSIISKFLSRSEPAPAANAATASGSAPLDLGRAGSALHPIYVQMAPTPPTRSWGKTISYMLWVAFALFVAFTIMSMILESTSLIKAGPGPTEFSAEEGQTVKFSDVHGVEEAKAELEEVVEFLRNPEKFNKLGGKLPKGVLLTGPPGTGKTMLARAVAGEAGVPFFFASGSSFDEMFVGVGAKRVRELFGAARKKAPAIVFIDELDAIGSKRSSKDQHYMKQTLNQLLVELDGFTPSESVIIIAATNFPQSLDKALTRPGRFDRHVTVGLPDVRGRMDILKHHMTNVHIASDVDPSIIARGTPGMSGADLQNLVNQAAIKASRDNCTSVNLEHFEWAKDRILMGAERRSHYVTDEAKRATAYHEGGHALVAMHTPGAMPLHKVTVMPRGQALGLTFQLPEADKDSMTRKEYYAMIDVALGGRAAEEMIFGHDDVTSGCSSDLLRATQVASAMIRNYGFSPRLGLAAHGDDAQAYLSSKRKDEIESEVKTFLDESMDRTRNLLKTHSDELHKLAEALVEYETLSSDEVRQVLKGEKLNRVGSLGESLKSEWEKSTSTSTSTAGSAAAGHQ